MRIDIISVILLMVVVFVSIPLSIGTCCHGLYPFQFLGLQSYGHSITCPTNLAIAWLPTEAFYAQFWAGHLTHNSASTQSMKQFSPVKFCS